MRIIGFNQGQIGDLALNIIPTRAIKEVFPNSHLIFSINKKYASAAPIFYHHPMIQEIKIWDGYDDWPTESDKKWIEENRADLFFNPNPPVTDTNWFLKRHHSEEVCRMHGIKPPKNLKVELVKYFDTIKQYSNTVAIAPFTSAGAVRDIPFEVSVKIIEFIHSLGFETIQLGLLSHQKLPTSHPMYGKGIFDDVKIAASCRLLITADTGINYIMSGYSHKVLGLYSTNCYPLLPPLKNRRPINENALYLEAPNVYNIDLETIKKTIKELL